MTLAEIKPMHGEGLYDIDGKLVGKWYGERGMFRDCFVVRERTCHIVLKPSDSDFTDEPHYLCSNCGKEAVYVYERRDYTLEGIVSHARYCSNCGARVVD